MAQCTRFHGGLVFFDNFPRDLESLGSIVATTLRHAGHRIDRQVAQPDGALRITCARVAVELAADTGAVQPRLVLSLTTAGNPSLTSDEAQRLLLGMLYQLIETYPAQVVEWLDPAVKLPAGRFIGAVTRVAPRRVHSRPPTGSETAAPFFPVEEEAPLLAARCDQVSNADDTVNPDETEALARAFRLDEEIDEDLVIEGELAPSDIRRLATWGMTGVVTCLSGPVGLSMAAVNLMRGEDFRLNTQVLALTGFLGMTTSSGVFTQMVNTLT